MKLAIKALSPLLGKEIPLPFYATEGAAAMDLHACLEAPLTLPVGGRTIVPTGLAVAIPAGHVGILAVRSSMGIKRGVTLANGIGVIDSDYRGEVGVGLVNIGSDAYTILPGDRIAQLMVIPVAQPALELVEELPATDRGEGGFGSTGR